MKRYWKLMSLCIVTIIIIGTFYTQSHFAAKEKIIVEWEKVSGNEEEVKDLLLNASSEGYLSLQISTEGTDHLSNQSIFKNLTSVNTVFRDMIKEHKKFMRGKRLMPDSFYEDDSQIAYANITYSELNQLSRDYSFDIAVLNKKTDEIISFKLDVPNNEIYDWIHVEEVQMIDNELKVITQGNLTGEEDELVSVITFDLENERIVDDEVIFSEETAENGGSHVYMMEDYPSIEPQKYLIITTNTYTYNDDGEREVQTFETLIYDIENKESKRLKSETGELMDPLSNSTINNTSLIIPSHDNNGFEVKQYDIEKEEWGKSVTFDFINTKTNSQEYMQLMNGKIYFIQSTMNDYTLYIGDLLTGELLYEGKLKVNKKSDLLQFHHIDYIL
ncbi:hypothetical protein WAK64_07960 [Bacillus spongiae]|uniref:DUF4340 domain-containing protein n=1 Tax=Bacillus spongiae TaxID=2683610 RepID=A0ABU8HCD2_9BACI